MCGAYVQNPSLKARLYGEILDFSDLFSNLGRRATPPLIRLEMYKFDGWNGNREMAEVRSEKARRMVWSTRNRTDSTVSLPSTLKTEINVPFGSLTYPSLKARF